jgi:gluconate 5-dehydrogenase
MNLNVRSIFLMSQAIGKHSMIPRRQGKIINVASIAGLAGNSADMGMVAYNTSKAAVVNFTRTLAGEWGKYNINVNALAPGMFPSKMTKGRSRGSARRSSPGTRRCCASATTTT